MPWIDVSSNAKRSAASNLMLANSHPFDRGNAAGTIRAGMPEGTFAF